MTDPLFSVIIACGHSAALLGKTLEGLSLLEYCRNSEVLVLDDGNYPGRESVSVKAAQSGIRIRYMPISDLSKAAAWNLAVRESQADNIAFLDDDCFPTRDWLSAFKTSLDDWNIGIVGGPDKVPKDSSIFERCLDYALTSFFGTLGMRRGGKRMVKYYPRPWNMAARRESIILSGGFDESFPEAPEVPMIRRMDQIGYRSAYQPEALVWHKRETDLQRFICRDFRLSMERARSPFQPGVKDVYSTLMLLVAILLALGIWSISWSRILTPLVWAYLFALGASGVHAIFTARTPAAVAVVPFLLAMHHAAHISGYATGKIAKGLKLR